MKRTTLQRAIDNGITEVYLDYRVFILHTVGKSEDDGLTYTLTNQNGASWRYYWDQVVYIPREE